MIANLFFFNSQVLACPFIDEESDCPDHSDEPAFTCRNRPCPTGWFRCANQSYKCIINTRVCGMYTMINYSLADFNTHNFFFSIQDGHSDCSDGSDENIQQCPTCHNTDEFRCGNSRCILQSLK